MPPQYPTYNPAEYGPNTGPTMPPQQDPYSYNNREQYDRRYDDPNRQPGPENVSDPGMSITGRPSANCDRQQD
jgi:hypothetical protein